ncbi:Uncharacterised protein [Candidatus Tiddalikarchaeum anstoanum]|nr:Uncharacterised protein [Candidatus Tiddalikarchaeum anstoanum]
MPPNAPANTEKDKTGIKMVKAGLATALTWFTAGLFWVVYGSVKLGEYAGKKYTLNDIKKYSSCDTLTNSTAKLAGANGAAVNLDNNYMPYGLFKEKFPNATSNEAFIYSKSGNTYKPVKVTALDDETSSGDNKVINDKNVLHHYVLTANELDNNTPTRAANLSTLLAVKHAAVNELNLTDANADQIIAEFKRRNVFGDYPGAPPNSSVAFTGTDASVVYKPYYTVEQTNGADVVKWFGNNNSQFFSNDAGANVSSLFVNDSTVKKLGLSPGSIAGFNVAAKFPNGVIYMKKDKSFGVAAVNAIPADADKIIVPEFTTLQKA